MDAQMQNDFRRATAWQYLKKLKGAGLLLEDEYQRASDLLTRRYMTA